MCVQDGGDIIATVNTGYWIMKEIFWIEVIFDCVVKGGD
jgi:hypothetical protein